MNVFKIIAILLIVTTILAVAKEGEGDKNSSNDLFKVQHHAADRVTQSLLNIGNWGYWVRYDGQSAHDPNGSSGGFYPRGTAACIYKDGLVWGGFREDDPNPRIGGSTYSIGTLPGYIAGSVPVTADEDERIAMYRIRKDYRDFENDWWNWSIRQDAAEVYVTYDPTDQEVQAVYEQYEHDWINWPVDLGAPYVDVDEDGEYNPILDSDGAPIPDVGDYPGLANADQVLWFVVNDFDEAATLNLYGSLPLGLEIQTTIWGYNQRNSPLGQVVFKKYKIINKSGLTIDSMFVSQWSDPDVGTYTDDLAGCDIEKSIGFAYSGFKTDGDYSSFGLPPAAVGYDFFQGPLVDGVDGQDLNANGVDDDEDFGVFDLKRVGPGKINLPMTSFIFFAAGSPISDPPLGDYDGSLEWYNMLNGNTPTTDLDNPTPFVAGSGTNRGQVTRFPLSGDPFLRTGDLDAEGDNFGPGDRRIALNSGPFTMQPGDTQEVVVAIVGGIIDQQGGDNLNAIVSMKLCDQFAQYMYDNLFEIVPAPPLQPSAKATGFDKAILLNWGFDEEVYSLTESAVGDFEFEGYNVYQLTDLHSWYAEWVKVATFDRINGITTIRGDIYNADLGDFIYSRIQEGDDTGIARSILLDKDYINDLPLYNGHTYYFAVSAYNYTENPDIKVPALESAYTILEVTPQGAKAGVQYNSNPGDLLEIDRSFSTSDGLVQAQVIDPASVTGHTYQLFFELDEDINSANYNKILWSINNQTTSTIVQSGNVQASSLDESGSQPIFDGLQVTVADVPLEFKNFQVTANANGAVDPPDPAAFTFAGFPTPGNPTGRQQSNGSTWAINQNNPADGSFSNFIVQATEFSGGFGEAVTGMEWLMPRDYEIRFVADPVGAPADAFYRWPYLATSNPAFMGTIPFEFWCLGADATDPADDYQCMVWIDDADSNGTFNLLAIDHAASGGVNDPYTDSFYIVEPFDRSQAGYEALLARHIADPAAANAEALWVYYKPGWNAIPGMMRLVFVNWNGGDVSDVTFPANIDAVMPEPGTIFQILTYTPHKVTDLFTFTAPEVTISLEQAREDVKKINVFPNPYYFAHAGEGDPLEKFVTFTHLPQKAVIRIFNLGGVLVRKLEKDNDSQFLKWNLRNEADYGVGNGLYIAHIKLPDLKGKKYSK